MKYAHITSRPNHEVGDRVIGLCGKKFKVKVLWADIPVKHPICRACVDTALKALTDADKHIESARVQFIVIARRFEWLREEFSEKSVLDEIVQAEEDYRRELEAKAEEKAAAEKVTKTCTCYWETQELFTVDPACPIHGEGAGDQGELDAIGVDLPEEES